MAQCIVCNGRTVQTEWGHRCLNQRCEGAKEPDKTTNVMCQCGQSMHFTTSNAYGDRNYACSACGRTATL